MGTYSQRVTSNGQNCYTQPNTSYFRNSTYLGFGKLGNPINHFALKFTGLTIPNGSTITSAKVTFVSNANINGTYEIDIYGEQGDAVADFSAYAETEGRTHTTAKVDWDGSKNWTAEDTWDTEDLSTIIQELIDDYGGLSSAGIAILLRVVSGSNQFYPYSYQESSTKCALLSIAWNAPQGPTVTTQSPTTITKTTCTGNGNITATGGINATRRGFCYKEGTTGDPTTSDSVAYDDDDYGTGAYTKAITGLSANTSYRIRAYAVNSVGTSYGDTVSFDTLISASYVEIYTTDGSLIPLTDDTIWLGQVDSPFKSLKGLIIKDTTNGKHYKITVISGTITATALD